MSVEIKTLTGSGTENYGVPYRNVYILNDGGKGWIRINNTLKLDIEKIDKVEGLTIKKLEWNLTADGTAVFVILSHEKLSTDYITRLMLSRIYSELQNKASKSKIVVSSVNSTATLSAGTTEVIEISPPVGKIWKLRSAYVSILPPAGATTGTHYLKFRIAGLGDYVAFTMHAYNSALYVIAGAPHPSATTTYPADANVWQRGLLSIVISHDYPLNLIYANNTDADQTNTRVIGLLFEEYGEGV